MGNKSYLRGHPIEFQNNQWVFSDTKAPTVQNWKNRPCGYCGQFNTKEGHDACLGELIGVMNACCGHGENHTAYIQFPDGNCIRGYNALKIMDILKNY